MNASAWSHPFLADPRRPLILASASPRRADILRAQGLTFQVEPAHVEEDAWTGEPPAEYARRLACLKARAVAQKNPAALVLGSDTIVVIDDEVLGKPVDATEAVAMIRRLAGREHVVISAAALACEEVGFVAEDHETTRVHFRQLGDNEIQDYVQTGEPMDKAGAYGIQGVGALMIDSISGDYFNVMGLPLPALLRLWRQATARE